MDLELSDEQQMLRETARRFFERECPKSLVRELLGSSQGHSQLLWNQMTEMDWLGLPLPEKYGGSGLAFLDLAVILEEIGRSLLPSPFCSTLLLGAYPILEGGTEEQKASLLPRVARGELVLTMALQESDAVYDPEHIEMQAQENGDTYVLNGVKLFVPYGHIADLILAVARTGSKQDRQGLSVFLIEKGMAGMAVAPLKPLDDSKVSELAFDGVRVPRSSLLGEISAARPVVDRALARCAVGECLQMTGAAQVALDMAIEHAKNRVQFGQPVAAFQAVQHLCADMSTDLDAARMLSYQAAWMLSAGVPCAKEVAVAKGWVSKALQRVVSRAHQVLGGVGFVAEHDLTLCFKRICYGAASFGGSSYHYRALGDLLGR